MEQLRIQEERERAIERFKSFNQNMLFLIVAIPLLVIILLSIDYVINNKRNNKCNKHNNQNGIHQTEKRPAQIKVNIKNSQKSDTVNYATVVKQIKSVNFLISPNPEIASDCSNQSCKPQNERNEDWDLKRHSFKILRAQSINGDIPLRANHNKCNHKRSQGITQFVVLVHNIHNRM